MLKNTNFIPNFIELRLFFFFIVVIFAISCSKKGNLQAFDPKQDHLEFGNGGGFTGAISSVCLFKNGDVYRKSTSDTAFIKIGKIDLNKAKQLFNNYQTLGLKEMKLDEPGNRYYFISAFNDGVSHKLTWGKSELSNNAPALLLKILNDMVKHIDDTKKQ